MDEHIKKLVVIPQTQYQQLIQSRQTSLLKPVAAPIQTAAPVPTKTTTDIDEIHQSSSSTAVAAVRNNSSDVDEFQNENVDDYEIRRRILEVIENSFSSKTQKKMKRLFIFIVSFGGNIIEFTLTGNVIVHGTLIGPKSNIIELLETAVTEHSENFSQPAGYTAFMGALQDINVPTNFIIKDEVTPRLKSKPETRTERQWKPY